MDNKKIVGCLAVVVLVVTTGAVGAWYLYRQEVYHSGPPKPPEIPVDFDGATADCSSLLVGSSGRAVSADELTVRAEGPVATIDGEPVTAEEFHRFVDWFYEPGSQPAAEVPLDRLVGQAARFYAVERTLDEAGVKVGGQQLTAYALIAWKQFDTRATLERYLDSVGLEERELLVEGCRGVRILNYLADEEGVDVTRGEVGGLLRSSGKGATALTGSSIDATRASAYLNLEQAGEHLPGAGSSRWSSVFETIETRPGNVRRVDGAEAGSESASEPGAPVVQARGDREGWAFLYPEHTIGGEEEPTRTLADLVAPADGGFELEMTSRDIPRTLFIPELGFRAVGMAGQSRSAPARIDWNADAEPPTVDAVDFAAAPFASYSRGLAHLSVETREVEPAKPEDGERAAARLAPTGRPLHPGANRLPFRLALRDAEGLAGYLEGLECDDPGDITDHLDEDKLNEQLAEAEASGSCDESVRATLTSQKAEAAKTVAEVESLYREECSTCHGEEGKGDGLAGSALVPPPTNFHKAEQWKQGRTVNDAFYATTVGVDETSMGAFGELSVKERWRLAYYVVEMLPEKKRADEPEATIETMCRRMTARASLFEAPCKSSAEEGP